MKNKLLFFSLLLTSTGFFSTTQAATQVFSGEGSAATSAFNDFKTAIKTVSGADGNRIGWDGVKLDGTDANPNTKIIDAGKTVEIPVDRFKNIGAIAAIQGSLEPESGEA